MRRWRASGLTAKDFAAREELNASTLSWWASRLGDRRRKPTFVDVTAVVATSATTMPTLDIVIRDSVRVRVGRGFDAELLRAVVGALEAR